MYDTLFAAQADHVDLWIGETMGSTIEARAVAQAHQRCADGRALWIAYSLTDEQTSGAARLWSGETVRDAVHATASDVDALLLNCAPPESIDSAMGELADALAAWPGVRFGAYANAFPPRPDEYAANEVLLDRREDLTGARYADYVRSWLALGASIVGGCCGMHPEHIAALSERMPATA